MALYVAPGLLVRWMVAHALCWFDKTLVVIINFPILLIVNLHLIFFLSLLFSFFFFQFFCCS